MMTARNSRFSRTISIVLIVGLLCPFAYAKIIYVDEDAAGANDGTSWENAYVYLQDALVDANDAEKPVEIRVAEGVYKPDQGANQTPGDRGATFRLINGVTLKGGYAGFGEPAPNTRDVELYGAILSGDLAGDDIPPWQIPESPVTTLIPWDAAKRVVVPTTDVNDDWMSKLDFNDSSWLSCTGPPGGIGYEADSDYGALISLDLEAQMYGQYPGCYVRIPFTVGADVLDGLDFVTLKVRYDDGFVAYLNGVPIAWANSRLILVWNAVALGFHVATYAEFFHIPVQTNTLRPGRNLLAIHALNSSTGSSFFISVELLAGPVSDGITFLNTEDNSVVVVTGSHIDDSACLNGFTITGGKGRVGMFNWWADPTILNCIFTGNTGGSGGGMLNHSSSPSLTGCKFVGNRAAGDPYSHNVGGGMVNLTNSNPILHNCLFMRNRAGSAGGGMFNDSLSENASCTVTMTDCTFRENFAGGVGGGMYSLGDDGTVYLKLTRCTFTANSAGQYGGGMYNEETWTTMGNCVFAGNKAQTAGGGLCCDWADVLTMTKCTFAGNSAEGGSSIACVSVSDVPIRLGATNCIFWGSSEPIQTDNTTLIAISDSDVQGDWPGEGNIDVDPLFANPGYWDPNGTPEEPNDDYWVNGDYHIKSQAGRWDPMSDSWILDDVTSPCIDAGDPNMAVGDEPEPNGGRINMGAYGGTAEASMSLLDMPDVEGFAMRANYYIKNEKP